MYSLVTDKTTQSSTKERSTVLTQVYTNPHCALCNGVPALKTTCWELQLVITTYLKVSSLAVTMPSVVWWA